MVLPLNDLLALAAGVHDRRSGERGWLAMSADQRKRVLGTIIEEMVVGAGEVSELVPREGWRPYLKAALAKPRVLSERKTGLEPANGPARRLVPEMGRDRAARSRVVAGASSRRPPSTSRETGSSARFPRRNPP